MAERRVYPAVDGERENTSTEEGVQHSDEIARLVYVRTETRAADDSTATGVASTARSGTETCLRSSLRFQSQPPSAVPSWLRHLQNKISEPISLNSGGPEETTTIHKRPMPQPTPSRDFTMR